MQSDCELTHQNESLVMRNESNERDEERISKCDEPSPQLCHFNGIRGLNHKCSANGKLNNHYVPEGSSIKSCKACANWFMRRVDEHCKNGADPDRELYYCDENCTTCKEYEQQFGQKKTVTIGAYREFLNNGMQPSLVKVSAEGRQKDAAPVIVENLPVDGSSKLSAGKEKFAEPQNNFEKAPETEPLNDEVSAENIDSNDHALQIVDSLKEENNKIVAENERLKAELESMKSKMAELELEKRNEVETPLNSTGDVDLANHSFDSDDLLFMTAADESMGAEILESLLKDLPQPEVTSPSSSSTSESGVNLQSHQSTLDCSVPTSSQMVPVDEIYPTINRPIFKGSAKRKTEVYFEQLGHDKKKRYEGLVNENCLEVSSQSSSPPVATIMAQNASGSHIIQPTCLPQPGPPTRELTVQELLYKRIKLETTFQSLLNARDKEWENASKKSDDNVGLQMAASTFYYTNRLIQISKYKSETALAQGIVPELNHEHGIYCTQLRTALPIESLPTLDGIDVENAIVNKYFDGSLVLELNYFNYGTYEEWPVDFLGKHMGAYDFIKIISEEGCSALRKDCLTNLVRACKEHPQHFLDLIPPCFIIGFRPALDWRSEVFERFSCQEENMKILKRRSVSGAHTSLSTVNHNGVEMNIYIYFGFENENEPYTNISCFEIFRAPTYIPYSL